MPIFAPLYAKALSLARRIGLCWEATRAPQQVTGACGRMVPEVMRADFEIGFLFRDEAAKSGLIPEASAAPEAFAYPGDHQ